MLNEHQVDCHVILSHLVKMTIRQNMGHENQNPTLFQFSKSKIKQQTYLLVHSLNRDLI